MRLHRLIPAAALVGAAATISATYAPSNAAGTSYAAEVRADSPTVYLSGVTDTVGGAAGTLKGDAKITTLPNGDKGLLLDGSGDYASFANRPQFSIATTGILTVEYLMRPDTLQFSDEEGTGYVYVLGKGEPTRHEWYGRMYSKVNDEARPNRISGYAFNAGGGLGAGSYFQDTVVKGRWIHVVLVFNTKATSPDYPMGYVKIYKDGVLRDQDSLADYNIRPTAGESPLRIGTGYLDSFFKGAVGEVAFYDRELSASRIAAHHAAW